MLKYKYTDTEIKKILKTAVILIDTRERVNDHITAYFDKKGVPYTIQKIDTGDYSVMLPKSPEMGIQRDLYIPVGIERKNSVDELVSSIKDRTRFENELIRSQKLDFSLLVEDPNGYENIILGKYRSQYEPKALLASLKTFEARYSFNTSFIDKKLSGNFIYHHLYYKARHELQQL